MLEAPERDADTTGDVDLGGRSHRGAVALAATAVAALAMGAVMLGRDATVEQPPPPTTTTTVEPRDGPLVLGPPKGLFAGATPFPGRTFDAEVLGLTAGGTLYRFDLDNGSGMRRVPIAPARRPPTALLARTGAVVVVTADGAAWAVPDDPSASPVAVGAAGHRYLAATDGGEVWRLPRFLGAGGTADLVDVSTGRVVASHRLPIGASSLTDDARHGLLVSVDDVTYRLDGASGALVRAAPGAVLGVSKRLLVESACQDPASCRVRVVDRTTGEPRPGGPLLRGAKGAPIGALSPDAGRVAFAPAADGEPLVVLTVDTGTTNELPAPAGTRPEWTPDGRTLLWLDAAGRLSAWSGGEIRVDRRSRLPDLVAMAVVAKQRP